MYVKDAGPLSNLHEYVMRLETRRFVSGCTLPSCYSLRANGVSHRYLLLGLLERLLRIILGILSGGWGGGGVARYT